MAEHPHGTERELHRILKKRFTASEQRNQVRSEALEDKFERLERKLRALEERLEQTPPAEPSFAQQEDRGLEEISERFERLQRALAGPGDAIERRSRYRRPSPEAGAQQWELPEYKQVPRDDIAPRGGGSEEAEETERLDS